MNVSPRRRGSSRRLTSRLAPALAITALTAAAVLSSSTVAHAEEAFSLEFNGAAGAIPSALKHETGGGGWGNNEAQIYTSSLDNSRLDGNGHLLIEARRSTNSNTWTSARLTTKGTFSFTYGTIAARISLPQGQGLHPAFWLLGTDIDTVGYPQSGEIDIAETINNSNWVHMGVHGPTGDGVAVGNGSLDMSLTSLLGIEVPSVLSGRYERNYDITGINPSAFHTYAVTKTPSEIRYSFDGDTVYTIARSSLAANEQWVFNKPIYALLNVAVGGVWPGPANGTTPNPSTMTVDWVRYTP
ncbi:glycoside hydrolase family 16 protein [Gordonia westfalica]|uniref:glycoside hydrolase family 16 protein n=1 Tax=Gordonia westfalica TaxID=158898 RepID=UPI000945CCBC|nr:glycoside hydrolase family 16 protein [Gordonia westfalica]